MYMEPETSTRQGVKTTGGSVKTTGGSVETTGGSVETTEVTGQGAYTTVPVPIDTHNEWTELNPEQVDALGRVVAGVPVFTNSRGESPFPSYVQVRQRIFSTGMASAFICGGSIIHAWPKSPSSKAGFWVVSAAHCLVDPNARYSINVFMGGIGPNQPLTSLRTTSEADPNAPGWYEIPPGNCTIYAHPAYSRTKRTFDVALIRCVFPETMDLPPTLTLRDSTSTTTTTTTTTAVDFSKLSQLPRNVPQPTEGVVVGFGSTQVGGLSSTVLQMGAVQIEPPNTTQLTTGISIYDGRFNVWATGMVNAQGQAVDTCKGDSGGPLYGTGATAGVVYAVTSWGVSCGVPEYPGVYARLQPFVDTPTGIFRDSVRSSSPWAEGIIGMINRFSPTSYRDTQPAENSEYQDPEDKDQDSTSTFVTAPFLEGLPLWFKILLVAIIVIFIILPTGMALRKRFRKRKQSSTTTPQ